MNRTIEEVVQIVRHQFECKNIEMELNLAEDIPMICRDVDKIKQVYVNLLMNFLQAINGKGKIKISTIFDKKEDTPLLVNHFARRICNERGITDKRFTAKALKAPMNRNWPGNVRQLENFVKRVVMFCPDDVIRVEDIEAMDDSNDKSATFSDTRKSGSIAIEPHKKAKDRVINRFT
ncbi:MAG: hypothetical protein DRG83_04765 [Deltaproteobacteria bacterium]|nr:MAG: hypothetical protein DRG83_04765 [Deltaproteobacteria bacterium]